MSNREHMLGHAPAMNDMHRGDLPEWCTPAYPLGLPKRITREAEEFAKRWAAKLTQKKIPLDPLAQSYLTPSDVPGVLIAAGPDAIFESLGRIEQAHGDAAADRAYHAIFARAMDDGDTETIAAMVRARELVMAGKRREYEARKAARIGGTVKGNERHAAMQHADAIGKAHAAQCRTLEQTKQEMAAYVAQQQNQQQAHALAGYTAEQQLMMREDRERSLRDDLERAWQERENIVAKTAGGRPLDVEFKPASVACGALGGLCITNDSARSLVLSMQGREVARF